MATAKGRSHPPKAIPGAQRTCPEQLCHHGEVGVRDGVVESGVAVGVRHVDYDLQQLGGEGPESRQVQRDLFQAGLFVAREPEPSVKHRRVRPSLQPGGGGRQLSNRRRGGL